MTITVATLKLLLEEADDNDIVVLSSDSEGNNYSPLASAGLLVYVPESTHSGEVYEKELTQELINDGYTKEDVYSGDDGQSAFVMWPTT